MTPRTLRLHPSDTVEVAIDAIPAGTVAAGVQVRQRIPAGHKVAVAAMPVAAEVAAVWRK